MKRRGFRFVGPTTAYALMQATGMVDDHMRACWVPSTAESARAGVLYNAEPDREQWRDVQSMPGMANDGGAACAVDGPARIWREHSMAAMKPRTGDGPLEATKEGRGIVMRVPLEGGGRLVVELTPDEAAALGDELKGVTS